MNQAKVRELLLRPGVDHDSVAAVSMVSRRTLQRLCYQAGWVAQPSTVKLVGDALIALYPPKPRGTK